MDLEQGRRDHSCGLIRDKVTGAEYVIVAGGQMNQGSALDTTELLEVANPTSWTYTGKLQAQFEEGQMARPSVDMLVYVAGKIPGIGSRTSLQTMECSNKVRVLPLQRCPKQTPASFRYVPGVPTF